MIELTDEQIQSLKASDGTPPMAVNPHTKETFVLLRMEEYERLKAEEYDDSPWTREELEGIAWEVAEGTGWEELGEDEKPSEEP
jgi:hypothetical protein